MFSCIFSGGLSKKIDLTYTKCLKAAKKHDSSDLHTWGDVNFYGQLFGNTLLLLYVELTARVAPEK